MCRIIFRAIDTPGVMHWKAGMVVTILEDGVYAGRKVEGQPDWGIVEVPGIPAADFGDLLGHSLPEPGRQPVRRVKRFDLAALRSLRGEGFRIAARDGVEMPVAEIRSVVADVATEADDAVIA